MGYRVMKNIVVSFVSQKGGVGKTALAAGLARVFSQRGRQVLAIDADPDQNLGAALGFPPGACPTPISDMRALIVEKVGADGGGGAAPTG